MRERDCGDKQQNTQMDTRAIGFGILCFTVCVDVEGSLDKLSILIVVPHITRNIVIVSCIFAVGQTMGHEKRTMSFATMCAFHFIPALFTPTAVHFPAVTIYITEPLS